MKSTLFINLLTIPNLEHKEYGRKLITLWADLLPNYIPEKFGSVGPIRNKFELSKLDSILDQWDDPFFFAKRRPKMMISVFQARGLRPTHGGISISLEFRQDYEQAYIKFLREASVYFNVDFAFMHLVAAEEFKSSNHLNTSSWGAKRTEPNLFVTTFGLFKNIPDLYWATIFGPPYLKLFGEDHLLSTPTSTVKKISDNAVYVQLTKSLTDLESDYDQFCLVRKENKVFLNHNAFYDETKAQAHQYNVPDFGFLRSQSEPKEHRVIIQSPEALAHSDQAIFELSQLLLNDWDIEAPKPDKTLLDYTVQSLDEINDYLDQLRLDRKAEIDWHKIILRCGAYVGKVIRRNSNKINYHWIDFETASEIAPATFKELGKDLGTAVMLYGSDSSFYFPMTKVHKYIINGSEDNIRLFAEAILSNK